MPNRLLQISERLYVFNCCKSYMRDTIAQLKDHYPEASILICNFGDKESSQIASSLSDYDVNIMEYPQQYKGLPLLPMEVIHHFLKTGESWLSLGQQHVLLMHCEQGGWPILAYMLAVFMTYKNCYSGEGKTLDFVYKQAAHELLQFFPRLNPLPSQLRYLQYVSRNVGVKWPLQDKALILKCVVFQFIPDFDGKGGFRPIFRIHGQDPLHPDDKTPKLLFSTPMTNSDFGYYKQAECELINFDINCHVQGDIVLEFISLHDDLTSEKIMFQTMFNTAFMRSNFVVLNRDEVDTFWDAKDLFHNDFRAKLIFSDLDTTALKPPAELTCFDEWTGPKRDVILKVPQEIATPDIVQETSVTGSSQSVQSNNLYNVAPDLNKQNISDVVKNKLQPKSASSPHSPAVLSSPPPPPLLKGKIPMEGGPTRPLPPPPPPPPPLPPPPPPCPCPVRLGLSQVSPAICVFPRLPPIPPPPPPPLLKGKILMEGGTTQPPPPHPLHPPAPPPSRWCATGVMGHKFPRSLKPENRSTKLKGYHWSKLRKVDGTIWAEAQSPGEALKVPEINMTELTSLFSTSKPTADLKREYKGKIEFRRAFICEIILSKIRIPLNELVESVLALDDSALDVDQVDKLIKICPTKEEMNIIMEYKGDKNELGICEQFYMELMRVPRAESKLRVFSFKLQFNAQVSELRKSLNIINLSAEQITSSAKLKTVMKTVLSLGNALNQGTHRGDATGFRLDSLLRLPDTRSNDHRMSLMHYLCKVLADKQPEVLDLSKDLGSLQLMQASKLIVRSLDGDMCAIQTGLQNVRSEKKFTKKEGPVSRKFRKVLRKFIPSAETEVRSLMSLLCSVHKNIDDLIRFFGEDPKRFPYESVISTLSSFIQMFNKANKENAEQILAEERKEENRLHLSIIMKMKKGYELAAAHDYNIIYQVLGSTHVAEVQELE